MIPICAAPKRFISALGKGRKRVVGRLGLLQQESFLATNVHQFGLSQKFSSAAPLLYESEHTNAPHTKPLQSILSVSAIPLIGARDAVWWTGRHPSRCAGVGANGELYSLPQLSLDGLSRKKIQDYFDNTWALTEVLLASLQGESAFTCPPYHDLRHPMIFYYGHPAALYVNKLRVAGLLKDPINPYFEVIFETGVDEMSWDDLSRNAMTWPSVAEVHTYRKKVYVAVSEVISNISEEQLAKGIGKSDPLWSLVMGFEHERIHLETSSVLISEMPVHLTRFPEGFPSYHESVEKDPSEQPIRHPVAGIHYPTSEMIAVEQQKITLGKPSDYPSFGWDNEYGSRSYDLPAFKASKFKTTNGEYWEFVRDGGYSNAELWSDAGWKWRSFRNVKWPCYWVIDGPQGLNHFSLRLLFNVVPMAWDLPVCVNMHEATAYANWKSMNSDSNQSYRVISELEHHAIRDESQRPSSKDSVDLVVHGPGQGKLLTERNTNFNLSCSSMNSVTALPSNERGFHDVFGNAWDWTTSLFSALKGFEVHPYYEDFSTPCFDGLHHIIMGGSFMSTGNEGSIYSRFHFRPHFFQHASIRLVEQHKDLLVSSDTDAPGPFVGSYPFRRSTKGLLQANLDSNSKQDRFTSSMSKNYGELSSAFQMPKEFLSASNRIKDLVLEAAEKANIDVSKSNILDVGCGQGGLSFLLSRQCRYIMGVDHNQDDIETARHLLDKQTVTYSFRSEGDRNDHKMLISASDIPYLHSNDFKPESKSSRAMSTTDSNTNSESDLEEDKRMEFRCSDPMCLPAELKGFDIVILNDIIDKVSAPGSVLSRLGGVRGMVRTGGLLLILSTYDWKETVTPRSLWLGGNGEIEGESPEQALTKRLEGDFECIGCEQIPIYWQESTRDMKGKLYHVTQWKRI